jgi:mRNA interferase MazF
MNEGDVALAALPQANGQVKPRPVIILRTLPPFKDWLVCGVSTQLQQRAEGFDELVEVTDSDFPTSGLKAASLIRLGFLAVLPTSRTPSAVAAESLPNPEFKIVCPHNGRYRFPGFRHRNLSPEFLRFFLRVIAASRLVSSSGIERSLFQH